MQKVQQSYNIYLDHASTTPIHPEILKSYQELLEVEFFNTDALYTGGVELSKKMENSRRAIAEMFGVESREVFFTSGATESNNFAIKGLVKAHPEKKHLITTSIEHSSVFNVFKRLEEEGYEVTYLPVDQRGIVDVDTLKKAVREDTLLISMMYVNNEVGSIQPIEEVKEWIKKQTSAFFHVDAVQAVGKLTFNCTNIDLMSVSAHKLGGLKGSGLLIKKKHVFLVPLIEGGQQENGLRGGTSNALVNLLFAKTLRLAFENKEKHLAKIENLKNYAIEQLQKMTDIEINTPKESVSSIVNFSHKTIPSEVMMNALNQRGIFVSSQSTCSSRSAEGSKVLKAMGFEKRAKNCIRISFSNTTTIEEIDEFVKNLREIGELYGDL